MPRAKQNWVLAACNFEVSAKDGRIQLLPYGEFRAVDGRPFDVPAWYLTENNGHDVAQLANQSQTQLVVDYEHQTLHKEKNGQPAPAAGWIRWVEFTPKGLFADVEWTERATSLIQSREYRYISAVFVYDTKGYVRKLLHAALTNNPALHGMDEVLAAASTQFFNQYKENTMNELLQQLFGLPNADETELKAVLTALLAAKPQAVALSADVFTQLADKDNKIAALTAQAKNTAQPDLTQYAPISVVQELQSQVAALTAQRDADKGADLIQAALTAGKLLPAQKEWAQNVLKQPNGLVFLTSFIENAQPVAALNQTQTDAKQHEDVRTCLPELERVGVIVGGFPCQDVSTMGKRAGLTGERTGLFFDAINIIQTLKPRFVVLENVVGLLNSNNGQDFQTVIETLADCGYMGQWRVLNARYFGVPQNRRRVFIVAGFREQPPLEFMGDARPMADVSSQSSTCPQDFFATQLAGLNSGTTIDLSCANIIAIPNTRHKMVERQRASEDYGFCRGLAQTDLIEARAAGNAVVPQVARWIAEKLIQVF